MSKQEQLPLSVTLPLSGISGMLAWVPTHPWEVLKNKKIFSGLSKETANKSTMSIAKQLLQEKGISGLFTGLGAGLSRQVIYTSFRLALYEPVKNTILMGRKKATMLDRVAAGALSGAMAAFLSSPIEVTLVLQTKATGKAPSMVSAFTSVYKANGVLGYWNGAIPLMTRAMIVGISQVAFFDQCKQWLVQLDTKKSLTPDQLSLTASSITGVFYAGVTMPVESARVRMSAQQGAVKKYTSMLQTMSLVAKEEGFKALYAAFFPYATRCITHTVVCFMTLDITKRLLVGKQKK